MIVIALERTVSKDFLLTLEDEKSDELQQNENIVSQRSKDEKEVIIEQNKKDENNKVHSSDGKHEITTVNSSDPESRSALQTFGRDYSNDGTEMMGWNSRPQKNSRKKAGKRFRRKRFNRRRRHQKPGKPKPGKQGKPKPGKPGKQGKPKPGKGGSSTLGKSGSRSALLPRYIPLNRTVTQVWSLSITTLFHENGKCR